MQAGCDILQDPSDEKKAGGEKQGNEHVKAIQKNEFRVFRQVLYLGIIGRKIAPAGDPTHMRPPETVNVRRVRIFLIFGVFVMMSMVIGPPEPATLDGCRSPQSEEELTEPGSAIGFMGEITVIDPSDCEHPYEVKSQSNGYHEPAATNPDHTEAAKMKDNEGNRSDQIDAVALRADHFGWLGGVVGIDPLNQ